MFYSEAIAVLEIPLSSFSRTLIFCSIDKVTCFLLGLALPPSWISNHMARPCLKSGRGYMAQSNFARACCSVDRSVRFSGVHIFEVLLYWF